MKHAELASDKTLSPQASTARAISAKTSNYSVVVGDDNTIFTNTGAGALVTFTLPASAGCTPGKTKFRFVALDPAFTIHIDLPGSDTLVFFGESMATSYVASAGVPANPRTATGYECMDVLYMGGGIWHGRPIGRWQV